MAGVAIAWRTHADAGIASRECARNDVYVLSAQFSPETGGPR
jgi:hypothetical protein